MQSQNDDDSDACRGTHEDAVVLVEFCFGLQMRALYHPRQCVICETHVGKMERRDQVRPYDVFWRRCMMPDTIDGQLPICAECDAGPAA